MYRETVDAVAVARLWFSLESAHKRGEITHPRQHDHPPSKKRRKTTIKNLKKGTLTSSWLQFHQSSTAFITLTLYSHTTILPVPHPNLKQTNKTTTKRQQQQEDKARQGRKMSKKKLSDTDSPWLLSCTALVLSFQNWGCRYQSVGVPCWFLWHHEW